MAGNIDKVSEFMENTGQEYEIIVVNDGSTDDSLKLLEERYSANPKIHVTTYDYNMGKGYAIKYGSWQALGDILFMDIDLATDIVAINEVLNLRGKADIIIASRYLKESTGGRNKSFVRNLMSIVSNLFVRVLVGINYKDTQCGFKYISKYVASFVINKQQIKRWAFDVEWLYIAKKHNLQVAEVPVNWMDDGTSVVHPIKASINFLKDLFYISFHKKDY